MADAIEKRRLAREKRKARVLNNTTDRLARLNSAFKADIEAEPTLPSSATTVDERPQTRSASAEQSQSAEQQREPPTLKPDVVPQSQRQPSSETAPSTASDPVSKAYSMPLALVTIFVATSTAFGLHIIVSTAALGIVARL